jgi:hypothetical protein
MQQVVPSPKNRHKAALADKKDQDGRLPGFSESVIEIVQILHKDVLMLVDDLDALTAHDQDVMFIAFRDIIDHSSNQNKKVSMRILALCRSNESFSLRAFGQEATIDISDGDAGDMVWQLAAALASMPDWTAEERSEVDAKVLSMAGSRFGYVSAIIMINIM